MPSFCFGQKDRFGSGLSTRYCKVSGCSIGRGCIAPHCPGWGGGGGCHTPPFAFPNFARSSFSPRRYGGRPMGMADSFSDSGPNTDTDSPSDTLCAYGHVSQGLWFGCRKGSWQVRRTTEFGRSPRCPTPSAPMQFVGPICHLSRVTQGGGLGRHSRGEPASGGGCLPQPRWAVCATGAGAHQGQTNRKGEKDIWWMARTARGGTGHLGRTETQRGRLWTACGQRCVDSKNSQTTPATTSTSSIRQLLGAADT